MKDKLSRVLTGTGAGKPTAEVYTMKSVGTTAPVTDEIPVKEDESCDDDTLSYLAKLADED